MKWICFTLVFWLLVWPAGHCQTPAIQALNQVPVALVGACIHPPGGKEIRGNALLFQGERILQIGKLEEFPKGIRVVQVPGLHLYPSFIDLDSQLGMPKLKKSKKDGPQPDPKRDPNRFYLNDAIRPDEKAAERFDATDSQLKEIRKAGIGYQWVHAGDGILGGTGCLVSSGAPKDASVVMDPAAFLPWSFDKGSSTQDYPNSLPGSVALIRQFLSDAAWYKEHPKTQRHTLVWHAYHAMKGKVSLVKSGGKWDLLLWKQLLSKEHRLIYLDAGDAYQRPELFSEASIQLALPAQLPYALDLNDPLLVERADLAYMKHWETAPTAPALFERQGKAIALYPGEEKDALFRNLRKMHQAGASKEYLLAALTTVPAAWMGLETELGGLKPGQHASFFLSTGDVFSDPKAEVVMHVVRGEIFHEKELLPHTVGGIYRLESPELAFIHQKKLEIKGNPYAPSGHFYPTNALELPIDLHWKQNLLVGSMESLALFGHVQWSMRQQNDSLWRGMVRLPEGRMVWFQAIRVSFPEPFDRPEPDTLKDDRKLYRPELLTGPLYFPFHAFGFEKDSLPQQEDVLLEHATVWTNTEQGILPDAQVWISKGKIKAVGQNLHAPKVPTIDLKGAHLTAGIIDEHAHIALRHGVNESGNAISAEVRMKDGLNPDDVNIYRQLMSGVTAAQLLHGSANPIGGQSALIKMRWGAPPDQLLVEEAPAFIKFALGENVKQANWGEAFVVRYPQTRMGVETFIREQFLQALKNDKDRPFSFREEALREIVAGKRFITCHSYVASEILMLMRLAESFGFKIRTFTHVLEGYKVATQLAAHGAAASTFSDWWAYKEEVRDAIPYNAGMMNKAGVLTALNSDDAAMGTRLNLEAAKMVRYSKLSEEEAWKMITLNPAKMLGVDHKMGAIAPGMDADLVWWNAHPLSVQARPEITWVDGRRLFSQERHNRLLQRSQKDRALLERKMLQAAQKGEKTRPVRPKLVIPYGCEDLH